MARCSFTWALAAALFSVFACNKENDPGGVEDKDGVNNVPPSESSGNGDGGEGGGLGKVCVEDIDCDDDDLCTLDDCVSFHCENQIDDDGDPCTTSTCDPIIGMSTPSLYDTVFEEDFLSDTDWILEGQWSIGPTAATTGGLDGGEDPANDPAGNPGGSVAQTGMGHVSPTGGLAERLRSPDIVIDDPNPNDFYTLRFQRWLNSDAPPIMTVTIEAFDGAEDVVVWQNTGKIIDAPAHGTGWFEVRIDVTGPFRTALENVANPNISFTFTKNGSGASVGGWTIDDLTIERSSFPVDDQLCTLDSCVAVDGVAVPVGTAMPPLMDALACTTFVCDAGSLDNPTQAEATPDCILP